MQGTSFQPRERVALAGDTVTWTNRDFTPHNARALDGFFSSPDLVRSQMFSHPFPSEGRFEYLCTIHPGMRGVVSVYQLWLEGPAQPVLAGRAALLRGLAPEGSSVTVQRVEDGAIVASVAAAPDGTFSASVPGTPAQYQARAAGRTSRVARVSVRPRVLLRAQRSGRAVALTVSASPAQPGARVVVERARGGSWTRIAGGRLSSASQARFRVAVTRTMRVRARTLSGVGGYAAGVSGAVVVRR